MFWELRELTLELTLELFMSKEFIVLRLGIQDTDDVLGLEKTAIKNEV